MLYSLFFDFLTNFSLKPPSPNRVCMLEKVKIIPRDLTEKNISIKKSTIAGPTNGLKMKLYLNFHENLTLFNSYTGGLGAIIRIENSSYLNDHFLDGIYVAPGLLTNIAVERTFRFNLPKPYSNCEIDNETPEEFDSELYKMIAVSEYEYNQQFCFKQCIQREIIKECTCSNPFLVSLFNVNKCKMEPELSCTDKTYFEAISNEFIHENCVTHCPLECNSTEYHASVSSIEMIGDFYVDYLNESLNLKKDFVTRQINAQTAKESIVNLNIFYESLSYTKTTEIAQMDLVSLLSNIGGTLSLFLGISVFSFYELVEVLIEIYFNFNRDQKSLK